MMSKVDVALLLLTKSRSLTHSRSLYFLNQLSARVRRRLYVAIDRSALNTPESSDLVFNFASAFYTEAHRICRQLDVRILLDNIKYPNTAIRRFDKIFLDAVATVGERNFISNDSELLLADNNEVKSKEKLKDLFLPLEGCCLHGKLSSYDGVVLGGTLDRLHNGHKILISAAALLAKQQFTCGVTDGPMIENKTLPELIEPVNERIQSVLEFAQDIDPTLNYKVVPITDPFGPSIVDTNLSSIVASKETERGARKVNEKRKEKGLNELSIYIIDLAEDDEIMDDESKISSSKQRRNILGTLFNTPNGKKSGVGPYVIGLSGGIASGKSNICKYLGNYGAHVIDCDKLAHQTYLPGTETYNKVVEAFGSSIIDGQSGNVINRSVLGSIVFSDESKRLKLNGIVWPAILAKVKEIINATDKSIVVLDAALLIEAGWDCVTDEIWVSVVPPREAATRLFSRNKLTELETKQRIDSQISNYQRLQHANIVFCSLWDYAVTEAQVKKAWQGLMVRLNDVQ